MKIPKHVLVPLIISVILFVIPFFWLKPGEMDLGGDSSRLYFYDPINYLLHSTLYSVSASAFGLETIYYFNFPFISLLTILKLIFVSPTVLISVFHGFSLSTGFIFTYLIIKELIQREKVDVKLNLKQYAAVLGGILYVLSPALIDGWEHVLLSRNQVFLNPLIFYLLLKYFKTSNLKYIFITILLTFIFSPNFSIISSPPIFAFYPISILFLILYTKLIIKRKILLKHLVLGFFLFLGVQAFHLLPQINVILAPGNAIYSTIFSSESKFDRGLSYFSAIAPNIKASINLLGFPQMKDLNLFADLFIFFPLIVVFSLVFNKGKTILLTTFFFLIILFFATANITNIGLLFYKALFNIPGFSMFRNFYGQWQFVYIFFYSILFAQSLYIVLSKLSKKNTYLLLTLLTLILLINAKPFITGELVRKPLWQSKDVVEVMQMDPNYKKALSFINALPADAKVLTLPMTDPGYQIVSGQNGGAYMGPSTIAYLAGKKDFAGFEEFQDYKSLISDLVKNKKYDELRRILGFLNIKYIFYNADPKIYDEFPSFPYLGVRELFPQDQKSYKEFVRELQFKEIKNINNKFFVFELQSDEYLPQIYVAKKTEQFNKQFTEINVPLSIAGQESRIAVDNNYQLASKDYPIKFDEKLIDIQDKTSFLDFFINADYSVGFPYAFSAWKTDSLVYPFVVWREKRQFDRQINDTYIETAILLADKRIGELERWGINIPLLANVKSIEILDKSWKEPTLWNAFISKSKYDFWEIGFLRYQRQIYDLIDKIERPNDSIYSSIANKEKLKKAVIADRERFYTIIEKNEKFSREKKIYLLKLVMGMFDSILNRLQPKIPSPENITYNLSDLEDGKYEIFIDKKSFENTDQSKIQVVVNNKKLYLKDFQEDNQWFKGQNITINNKEDKSLRLLSSQLTNLVADDSWRVSEIKNFEDEFISLTVEDRGLFNKDGLIREIGNWTPNSYYKLSFEYLTYGKGFKLMTYDKDLKKDSDFKKILQADLRSSEWKSYEVIFSSSKDAHLASLQILRSEAGLIDTIGLKDKITKIDIKNLSIIQVPNPKIILKKIIIPNKSNEILPKITFTKINPTKYEVKVENVAGPYTLVLMNQFNSKWRVVDSNQNTGTIGAFFSRFISSVGKKVLGFLGKENLSINNTQLTYFEGDIKENSSKNIFLNEKTFETWGKREIAGNKHFAVNGYANAWYIEPKDMNGKTNYTVIIEMTTQRIFYVSLVISIFTLILTIVVLIKVLLRNK